MPLPTPQHVQDLLSAEYAAAGFDIDDVVISSAGKHSTVRIVVDGDRPLVLDDVAQLSRIASAALDALASIGETPYTLEVTSPGVDRPMTLARHFTRARGRRALFELADGEELLARIGETTDSTVTVAVRVKKTVEARVLELADITKAVVQVEFRRPDPEELAVSGGIPDGRAVPGELVELDDELTDEDLDDDEAHDEGQE